MVVLHYQEAVHNPHPLEVVLVHCSKVDILVQLDCLHNFLHLAVDQEVYPHQEDYLLHQEVVHSPHPLEVVLDLPAHHFEDTQAHKGCHHNLGFVIFHLEEAEGQLVNM